MGNGPSSVVDVYGDGCTETRGSLSGDMQANCSGELGGVGDAVLACAAVTGEGCACAGDVGGGGIGDGEAVGGGGAAAGRSVRGDVRCVHRFEGDELSSSSALAAVLGTVAKLADVSVIFSVNSHLAFVLRGHGLDVREGVCNVDMILVLFEHVLSGGCFQINSFDKVNCLLTAQRCLSSREACYGFMKDVAEYCSLDVLKGLAKCVGMSLPAYASISRLKEILLLYRERYAAVSVFPSGDVLGFINGIRFMSRMDLERACAGHGIVQPYDPCGVVHLRGMLMRHLCSGACANGDMIVQCRSLVNMCFQGGDIVDCGMVQREVLVIVRDGEVEFAMLRLVVESLPVGVVVDSRFSALDLKGIIAGYIEDPVGECLRRNAPVVAELEKVRNGWPRVLSDEEKSAFVSDYRAKVCKDAVKQYVCASCASLHLSGDGTKRKVTELNIALLLCLWLPLGVPRPVESGIFQDYLIHPDGIIGEEDGGMEGCELRLCWSCDSCLRNNRLPPLSMANRNYLGPVPDELQGLTMLEYSMIARSRASSWIVHIKQKDPSLEIPTSQRGVKGHTIIYPQDPSKLLTILPPSVDEILTYICVIFVGSVKPSREWFESKAKPLYIRKEKVRNALEWLKANNPLYGDVAINDTVLDALPAHYVPPFDIQLAEENESAETLISSYCGNGDDVDASMDTFESIVITDVDVNTPAQKLRAAALRHFKQRSGGFLQYARDPLPVNEMRNPYLLPMLYPGLFPYGIGGPDDCVRPVPLSFVRHIKLLMFYCDRRFQAHPSFMFTVFNIVQRHKALLTISLRVKRSSFRDTAARFSSIDKHAIDCLVERLALGEGVTNRSPHDADVHRLMNEVKAVLAPVPGSSASKVIIRNEIRSLIIDSGLPTFYITINPADVHNPVVSYLAGDEIDVDKILAEKEDIHYPLSCLIAQNPAVGSQFFNVVMRAYIESVLGYRPVRGVNVTAGVFGVVKAYYGCVEAQGRGSLHCHMIVWVEGSLNSSQIRDRISRDHDMEFHDRLLRYIDSTLYNSVPPPVADPGMHRVLRYHPSSTVGFEGVDIDSDLLEVLKAKDYRFLVEKCQVHEHRDTCFKYCGPGERVCRFGLGEGDVVPAMVYDWDAGSVVLRREDLMVNNYNDVSLRSVRCNTDAKYISSGPSAKSVVYYVTDYISKSPLKSHVAYSALQTAVKNAEEGLGDDTGTPDPVWYGKRVLQKCTREMLSKHEFSAQQVSSYLMGFPDHFTSHRYRNLYWSSFEKYVDQLLPSPECYQSDEIDKGLERNERTEVAEVGGVSGDNVGDDDDDDDDLNSDSDGPDSGDAFHDPMEDVSLDVVEGQLVPAVSQLADYLYRGSGLDDICLWDYVGGTDKIAIKGRGGVGVDDPNEDSGMEDQSTTLGGKRGRPRRLRVRYLAGHAQHSSHERVVLNASSAYVVVPCGPAIPRRDHPSSSSRHARLMLVFFRPWRVISDLRGGCDTWIESYERFRDGCSPRVKELMKNMQVLHECKDSRDQHFAQMMRERHASRRRYRCEAVSSVIDDFGVDESPSGRLLDHLGQVQEDAMESSRPMVRNARDCAEKADAAGMFTVDRALSASSSSNAGACEDLPTDYALEDVWASTYEKRRQSIRSMAMRVGDDMEAGAAVQGPVLAGSSPALTGIVTLPRSGACNIVGEVEVGGLLRAVEARDFNSVIRQMVATFSLNYEQCVSFVTVAEHSQLVNPEQLLMYTGGEGGTGKSRVIQCWRELFRLLGQSRRLRLLSSTGAAAQNIQGMTLHAALSLFQLELSKGTPSTRIREDLIAMWQGVDYMFIDEVSMIGCSFLMDVHEALVIAKGSTAPFGGVNVIFAGDFAQLAPVGQSKLFKRMFTGGRQPATNKVQRAVLGQRLWHSVSKVVMLKQVMRQSGGENECFVQLLRRLRVGNCNEDDYRLLHSRVIGNMVVNWDEWRTAPVVVSDNMTKDVINAKAAEAFAKYMGVKLTWYCARDYHAGVRVEDEETRERLLSMPAELSQNRPALIPLVVGMPVMITHNFDVGGGGC